MGGFYYVYTHGDRVRLAPIQGCGMVCKFCNIPYEDRYNVKPIDAMIEALHTALEDPVQPARHVLISGGTPKQADVQFLRETYRRVLNEFPDTPVDIMMVPVDGLLDVAILPDVPEGEQLESLKTLLREGTAAIERGIVTCRAPWVEVRVADELYVNLDGEPTQGSDFRFEAFPRWLHFHLPAEAPLAGD